MRSIFKILFIYLTAGIGIVIKNNLTLYVVFLTFSMSYHIRYECVDLSHFLGTVINVVAGDFGEWLEVDGPLMQAILLSQFYTFTC